MNLGAIIKRDYRNITHKDRDAFLGTGITPESYTTDIGFISRNSQKSTPTCGAHAGSHLKAILDKEDTGTNRYSPIFLWRAIKTFDGFKPEEGTNIESIMKALKSFGECDWNLLPTDFEIETEAQAYTKLTQEQLDNAQPRIIKSFAVTYNPTMQQVKDIIYKDKAAILLLRFDGHWWTTDTLEENGIKYYGHFVTAYGFNKNYIKIIDSSDDNFPYKNLGTNFSVLAIASAVDLPDAYVKSLVKQRSILQQLVELYRQLKALLKK